MTVDDRNTGTTEPTVAIKISSGRGRGGGTLPALILRFPDRKTAMATMQEIGGELGRASPEAGDAEYRLTVEVKGLHVEFE